MMLHGRWLDTRRSRLVRLFACRLATDEGEGEQSQGGGRRRRATADADPGSTLENSFEALNVKKFDLAFAVDPLFHKTSAQFDEGGASGEFLCMSTLTLHHFFLTRLSALDAPGCSSWLWS